MPRGMFTQAAVILCKEAMPKATLSRIHPAATELPLFSDNKYLGDYAFILPYLPEVNGYIRIDSVSEPWPDFFETTTATSAAWDAGYFGPYTESQSMASALAHSWFWAEARDVVPTHKAFVRIMSTYQLDSPDGPYTPGNYNAAKEIAYLAKTAGNLLKCPEALCYFNPGGEVLMSYESFRESYKTAKEAGQLPLEAWSNLRIFHLEDLGWQLLDVRGNEQLGLPDLEMWFPNGDYEINDAAGFLRDLTFHLFRKGPQELADFEFVKGPGDKQWRAFGMQNSYMPPHRQVIALRPNDLTEIPEPLAKYGLV